LSEAIRRRPYAVVLFEIEKAHPDVFNIMLQILMMAALPMLRVIRWTSKHHYHYDQQHRFPYILDLAGDDSRYEEMRNRVMEDAGSFRPVLNRIDEIIIFHALQKQELRQIVQLQVARLVQRLIARCRLSSPMLLLTF